MCLESSAIQVQQNKYKALVSTVSGSPSVLPSLVLSLELQSYRVNGNVEACDYSIECHLLKQNCLETLCQYMLFWLASEVGE